jgi:DNA (cytosine-5)-methyltransferase 1
MTTTKTTKIHVASFFAGIGGFDLGFERAGAKVVFQCEIDKFCRQVLKKHWPQVELAGDIKMVEPKEIPKSANVWTGGFPCQDVSLANQGKRKGLEGERTGLFFEFIRLVERNRPSWIVLENVPGLLNSNNGEDFRTILNTLGELGYGVAWRILDAKYFGTPQRRRRVYIVASYRSLRAAEVLFEPGASQEVHRASLGERDLSTSRFATGIGKSTVYSIQHATIGRKPEAGPQAKGFRNDGETYTLDSRGSADVVCKTNDAFRVREASGFSERVDSARHRAIGNAVCVPVVEWIAKRIISTEKKSVTEKSKKG